MRIGDRLFDAVRHFVLGGGKRCGRPSATGRGADHRAGQAADDQTVLTVGAALERFIAAALIHDDIIDGSSRRRGTDSLHESFAAQHTQHRWRGDPARFGRNIALLCGDLCASWSDVLVRQSGAPPDRSRAARAYSRSPAPRRLPASVSTSSRKPPATARAAALSREALRVTRLKTARYSVCSSADRGGTGGRWPAAADRLRGRG